MSDPVTSHRTWVGPRNNIHFGDNERHHVVPVELFKKERRQKLPSGGYKWAPNGSQHSLFGRLYSATDSSQQARDAFFAIFNPANMKTNGISLPNHSGSHPEYTKFMQNLLTQAEGLFTQLKPLHGNQTAWTMVAARLAEDADKVRFLLSSNLTAGPDLNVKSSTAQFQQRFDNFNAVGAPRDFERFSIIRGLDPDILTMGNNNAYTVAFIDAVGDFAKANNVPINASLGTYFANNRDAFISYLTRSGAENAEALAGLKFIGEEMKGRSGPLAGAFADIVNNKLLVLAPDLVQAMDNALARGLVGALASAVDGGMTVLDVAGVAGTALRQKDNTIVTDLGFTLPNRYDFLSDVFQEDTYQSVDGPTPQDWQLPGNPNLLNIPAYEAAGRVYFSNAPSNLRYYIYWAGKPPEGQPYTPPPVGTELFYGFDNLNTQSVIEREGTGVYIRVPYAGEAGGPGPHQGQFLFTTPVEVNGQPWGTAYQYTGSGKTYLVPTEAVSDFELAITGDLAAKERLRQSHPGALEAIDNSGKVMSQDDMIKAKLADGLLQSTENSPSGTDAAKADPNVWLDLWDWLTETPNEPTAKGIGLAFGSALGQYLAGDDPILGIVTGSALGAVAMEIGSSLGLEVYGSAAEASEAAGKTLFGRFQANFQDILAGSAVGTLSSFFAAELGEALGVEGFAGGAITAAAGGVFGLALDNLLLGQGALLQTGNLAGAFDKMATALSPGNVAGAMGSALTSYFASKLASSIVAAETQAGAILGSLGSAIGSFVFGTVGSFVGQLLGTLIGNLFGRKKPRIPTANAEVVLQIPSAVYALGAETQANNGNLDLARSMATAARDTLNGVIRMVTKGDATARVDNITSPTQVYGHTGNQIWVKLGGSSASPTNFSSADDAVDKGVLWALPATRIIGGDLYLKRAIYRHTSN